MREFTINSNDSGQRLDKFVLKTVWGLPLSLMYKFIRKKRIKVNGKRAEEKQMLSVGDTVQMYIPDEFFEKKVKDSSDEFSRVKPSVTVIYEDENIILCDKRPGVLTHTGDGNEKRAEVSERETLIFNIKAYLCQKGEYDPDSENSFSPALCNRIDRNTGGIVIAAKNAEALREMNALIKDGGVHKKYLCAVHGFPAKKEDILRGWLFKNSKTKTVRVTDNRTVGAKEIVTGYKVLSENKKLSLSLLEVTLYTGRTHQIRAHLASVGHPLLGEGKYARNKEDRAMGYSHQALYSYKVAFVSEDGFFAYLNGKEFTADRKNISFLKLFDRGVSK